jgi:hypothetical protein
MFQEGGLRVQAPRPAHLASIAARLRQAAMIYLLEIEYFGFLILSTGTCSSILDPDCIGFNWVIGRVADPRCLSRIRIFFPIQDQGSKKHRISDPDPQKWSVHPDPGGTSSSLKRKKFHVLKSSLEPAFYMIVIGTPWTWNSFSVILYPYLRKMDALSLGSVDSGRTVHSLRTDFL